jgi:hypothetical protein
MEYDSNINLKDPNKQKTFNIQQFSSVLKISNKETFYPNIASHYQKINFDTFQFNSSNSDEEQTLVEVSTFSEEISHQQDHPSQLNGEIAQQYEQISQLPQKHKHKRIKKKLPKIPTHEEEEEDLNKHQKN